MFVAGFNGTSTFMNGAYTVNASASCNGATVYTNGLGGVISEHNGTETLNYFFIGNASLLACNTPFVTGYAVFSESFPASGYPGDVAYWDTSPSDVYSMQNVSRLGTAPPAFSVYCMAPTFMPPSLPPTPPSPPTPPPTPPTPPTPPSPPPAPSPPPGITCTSTSWMFVSRYTGASNSMNGVYLPLFNTTCSGSPVYQNTNGYVVSLNGGGLMESGSLAFPNWYIGNSSLLN